jgi:cytoplasmic iron level regulating protein YaaA (DUF328/UPF0246 family)
MGNYIILLPNSEKKTKGGNEDKVYRFVKNLRKNNYFLNRIDNERNFIYSKLKELISVSDDINDLESVFDLKDKNLQEAVEIVSDMLNLPTRKAIERYDGVMFKSINFELLDDEEKKRFYSNVFFIDALFGILKSDDLIPEYKLKFGSKFMDIDISKFWKINLTGVFDILFKDKIILDVLPQSHREIISYNQRDVYYQIKFCEIKKGKLVNIGHDSKKLKGEFIRYVISKENIKKEDLKVFSHTFGYKYSEKYSDKNEIVYLKS